MPKYTIDLTPAQIQYRDGTPVMDGFANFQSAVLEGFQRKQENERNQNALAFDRYRQMADIALRGRQIDSEEARSQAAIDAEGERAAQERQARSGDVDREIAGRRKEGQDRLNAQDAMNRERIDAENGRASGEQSLRWADEGRKVVEDLGKGATALYDRSVGRYTKQPKAAKTLPEPKIEDYITEVIPADPNDPLSKPQHVTRLKTPREINNEIATDRALRSGYSAEPGDGSQAPVAGYGKAIAPYQTGGAVPAPAADAGAFADLPPDRYVPPGAALNPSTSGASIAVTADDEAGPFAGSRSVDMRGNPTTAPPSGGDVPRGAPAAAAAPALSADESAFLKGLHPDDQATFAAKFAKAPDATLGRLRQAMGAVKGPTPAASSATAPAAAGAGLPTTPASYRAPFAVNRVGAGGDG